MKLQLFPEIIELCNLWEHTEIPLKEPSEIDKRLQLETSEMLLFIYELIEACDTVNMNTPNQPQKKMKKYAVSPVVQLMFSGTSYVIDMVASSSALSQAVRIKLE